MNSCWAICYSTRVSRTVTSFFVGSISQSVNVGIVKHDCKLGILKNNSFICKSHEVSRISDLSYLKAHNYGLAIIIIIAVVFIATVVFLTIPYNEFLN